MAASSPAKSISVAADATAASVVTPLSSNTSKNLRGLNKPKCIKCGNVARSRCPYQSCKNCCAKAQNPCHIHVLKGNSSLPDKVLSSSSPLFDHQSNEASHSGSSHRLRQLSNNFAQFSNLQAPFRSRKPLTRKDAQVINEWRFLKLKEFRDRNNETENEAFDRYMQNACLLEEVFLANSEYDDYFQDLKSKINLNSEANIERMVLGMKLKLRSNQVRIDNFRKRIHHIVDQGLRKLGKFELIDGSSDLSDAEGLEPASKKIKSWQAERASASNDLLEKLNQARNEEDLKACWEIASQIFEWNNKACQIESGDFLKPSEQNGKSDSSHEQSSLYSQPKWVSLVTIDHESLSRIDAQFSSLEEIEDL